MFFFPQFKLAKNYKDVDDFKIKKFPLHVVLWNKGEDVWSFVKIVKIMSITLNAFSKGVPKKCYSTSP